MVDKKEDKHWLSVAKNNGIQHATFMQRVKRDGWDYERAATKKPVKFRDYDIEEFALYKGDNLLAVGTIYEIAEATSKSINQLRSMLTPKHKKKITNSKNSLLLEPLEDDEDDVM